jgi:hypothetical protein
MLNATGDTCAKLRRSWMSAGRPSPRATAHEQGRQRISQLGCAALQSGERPLERGFEATAVAHGRLPGQGDVAGAIFDEDLQDGSGLRAILVRFGRSLRAS